MCSSDLTVVDVNSGSFTRSATARETVLWTNCEAATEIARQLRLRNLAGVIIIDFIDMESRRDQLQVLERFTRELSQDKARPQIAQLSELGLVELTRKRQGQNIYELFSLPCDHCGGLGHVLNLPGEEPTQHDLKDDNERRKSRRDGKPRKQLPDPVREPIVSNELELDTEDDLQELDLISHPSYQELGEGRNNRRRRRRRRFAGDEGKTLDEALPKPTPKDAPILRRDRSTDEEEPETDAPSEDTRKAPAAKSASSEKNGRSRREPREPRPEPVEPERITVEMAADEQEVYALMGLSPLLKLEREVENPKAVSLVVVEPGQAVADAEEPEASEPEASEPEASDASDAPDESAASEPETSEPETSETDDIDAAADAPDEVPASQPEPELAAAGAGKGSGKSRSPRRRRRRSSASSRS